MTTPPRTRQQNQLIEKKIKLKQTCFLAHKKKQSLVRAPQRWVNQNRFPREKGREDPKRRQSGDWRPGKPSLWQPKAAFVRSASTDDRLRNRMTQRKTGTRMSPPFFDSYVACTILISVFCFVLFLCFLFCFLFCGEVRNRGYGWRRGVGVKRLICFQWVAGTKWFTYGHSLVLGDRRDSTGWLGYTSEKVFVVVSRAEMFPLASFFLWTASAVTATHRWGQKWTPWQRCTQGKNEN